MFKWSEKDNNLLINDHTVLANNSLITIFSFRTGFLLPQLQLITRSCLQPVEPSEAPLVEGKGEVTCLCLKVALRTSLVLSLSHMQAPPFRAKVEPQR